jgi:hypothetical protein
LLAPLAVLLGQMLARDGLAVVPTAIVVGVLAAAASETRQARVQPLEPEWTWADTRTPFSECP